MKSEKLDTLSKESENFCNAFYELAKVFGLIRLMDYLEKLLRKIDKKNER